MSSCVISFKPLLPNIFHFTFSLSERKRFSISFDLSRCCRLFAYKLLHWYTFNLKVILYGIGIPLGCTRYTAIFSSVSKDENMRIFKREREKKKKLSTRHLNQTTRKTAPNSKRIFLHIVQIRKTKS